MAVFTAQHSFSVYFFLQLENMTQQPVPVSTWN